MTSLQMSMYYVVTHSFTLWPDAYECPNVTTKWKSPVFGSILLGFGILFIILYIPCFIAITKKMTRAPVYQIMFALAIFDIVSLSIDSVCTGIFNIMGISFCDYPLAIYILGALASSSWMAGCFACVLLAIERCVEINPNFCLEFLFRKSVFPFVRLFMMGWTVYGFGFAKIPIFVAEYSAWIFDPMVGKNPSLYQSFPHTVSNFVVAISTSLLYIYISYRLIFQFGYSTSMWLYKTKKQILFQAISLCIFHTAVAVIYEYMKYVEFTPNLLKASQFLWQWSSGAVCLTYLIFNRTIRNAVLKMTIPKKIRKRFGLHIGVEEHIELEDAAAAATVSASVAVVNTAGGVVKYDNFLWN